MICSKGMQGKNVVSMTCSLKVPLAKSQQGPESCHPGFLLQGLNKVKKNKETILFTIDPD